MTRNSLVLSPVLLRRKHTMAWGTTTDRVTTEINPFLYARETKLLYRIINLITQVWGATNILITCRQFDSKSIEQEIGKQQELTCKIRRLIQASFFLFAPLPKSPGQFLLHLLINTLPDTKQFIYIDAGQANHISY